MFLTLAKQIGKKCLSHGHNDALSSLNTKPRVDNFAATNSRSHPLSSTAATGGILALSVIMPRVNIEIATLRLLFGTLIYKTTYPHTK